MLIRLVPIAVLFVLACGRGGGGSSAQPMPAVTRVFEPVRIYYDNRGGIADSTRLLIRDRATFEETWRQATSRQSAPPAPPAVDFSAEMVVVVGAGRMTPNDRIAVDSANVTEVLNADGELEETLRIVVRTTVACQQFEIDAYPLQIVRLRRFDGPVRWEERTENENCMEPPAR